MRLFLHVETGEEFNGGARLTFKRLREGPEIAQVSVAAEAWSKLSLQPRELNRLAGDRVEAKRVGELLFNTVIVPAELGLLAQLGAPGQRLHQMPVRLRVLASDPQAHRIPWRCLCRNDSYLEDDGWSFTLGSADHTPCPSWGLDERFPSIVALLPMNEDLDAERHEAELRACLPDNVAWMRVRCADEVRGVLAEAVPDLVYVYGHGVAGKTAALQLDDRELSVDELMDELCVLRQMPALILNACHQDDREALLPGRRPAERAPFVLVNPASVDAGNARAFGVKALRNLLDGKRPCPKEASSKIAPVLYERVEEYRPILSEEAAEARRKLRTQLDRQSLRSAVLDGANRLMTQRKAGEWGSGFVYLGTRDERPDLFRAGLLNYLKEYLQGAYPIRELDIGTCPLMTLGREQYRAFVKEVIGRHENRIKETIRRCDGKSALLWLDWGVCGHEAVPVANPEQLAGLMVGVRDSFKPLLQGSDIKLVSLVGVCRPEDDRGGLELVDDAVWEANGTAGLIYGDFRVFSLDVLKAISRKEMAVFLGDHRELIGLEIGEMKDALDRLYGDARVLSYSAAMCRLERLQEIGLYEFRMRKDQ